MKQTEHIVSVLTDVFKTKSNNEPLTNFRVLCSADHLKTQIYVYQSKVDQGSKFEIQAFTVDELVS